MIELKSRVFSTEFAKIFARKVYGFPISNNAWVNWRRWANIPPRSRFCDYDQLCCIVVRTTDRLFGEGKFPELDAKKIREVIASVEFQKMIASGVHFLDGSGFVIGKDALRALELNGINISSRTVRRKIPGFSTAKIYNISELKRQASA